MKEKIAFFGASVTQQVDGYWKYFSINNPNFDVKNFGYGSMHLNDAGIVYVDEVLSYEPNFCFIDWFSTGYIEYEKENFEDMKKYIDAILYKFLSKNIQLIFLTFPDVSLNSRTNKPVNKKDIYKKLNGYIRSFGVPTIDISETFDDLSIILRDGIHTTQQGSIMYSEKITDEFLNTIYHKSKIVYNYPEKNKYCEVKKLEINTKVYKELVLEGNGEVIGISQVVGPYSGLLDINGKIFNNWDRWCYYERPMVNLKFDVLNNCVIKIIHEDFDRSLCQNNSDWPMTKMLNLNTMYYVGESIKITKIE